MAITSAKIIESFRFFKLIRCTKLLMRGKRSAIQNTLVSIGQHWPKQSSLLAKVVICVCMALNAFRWLSKVSLVLTATFIC